MRGKLASSLALASMQSKHGLAEHLYDWQSPEWEPDALLIAVPTSIHEFLMDGFFSGQRHGLEDVILAVYSCSHLRGGPRILYLVL